LLYNDLETNNETTFAARQQILNKQLYAAVIEHRLLKQTRSQGNDWSTTVNGVFCAVHAEVLEPSQSVITGRVCEVENADAEKSPLVEAVTREQLEKTHQTEKTWRVL
jgi:hypothetical protein